jgi:hypothetical protein
MNRVARKIVYEVITTGGGVGVNLAGNPVWQQNPKIVSVAIQVATGWVWDLIANLSPNAKTNSASTPQYAYQQQSVVGMFDCDAVVAYNFLKQLWRQRGGQCTLTLANGESYPALIQALDFESPKPLAASFRSDVQTTYQSTVTLKVREDI